MDIELEEDRKRFITPYESDVIVKLKMIVQKPEEPDKEKM